MTVLQQEIEEKRARFEETVRAFRIIFNSPSGEIVLQELISFCKFRTEITSDIEEGKRRVLLHILELAKFNDEQLLNLYLKRGRVWIPEQTQ